MDSLSNVFDMLRVPTYSSYTFTCKSIPHMDRPISIHEVSLSTPQLPNIFLLQNKRATQTVIDQIAHSRYLEKELDLDQTETNFDFGPAADLSANADEKLALAAAVLVQH